MLALSVLDFGGRRRGGKISWGKKKRNAILSGKTLPNIYLLSLSQLFSGGGLLVCKLFSDKKKKLVTARTLGKLPACPPPPYLERERRNIGNVFMNNSHPTHIFIIIIISLSQVRAVISFSQHESPSHLQYSCTVAGNSQSWERQ